MSKPSFNNIDRWFFEYSEGNLSPAQIKEFEMFLSEHPELQSELDVWEDSRVQPADTEGFVVSSLHKPVVPYTSILKYVGISVLLFLSGFIAAKYFQNQPKYVTSVIDTSIIEIEDEDLFNGKYVLNETSISAEIDAPSAPIKNNYSNQGVNRIASTSSNVLAQSKSDVLNTKKEPTASDRESLAYSSNDQNADEFALTANNKKVSSQDLPQIIDYLNGDDKGMTEALAEDRSSVKVIEASSAFKRKMRSVLRKIKRMADQPIALKNTKDQYFHVPMMTGFVANYGMVGSARGNRFQMTSRNQWVGHANQQLQNTASWDGYVYALRGGLGVDVSYSDYQSNAIQNYSAALTYSPKFSLNKNVSIEPALRFKMGMVDVNSDSPVLGSNIEMNRSNVTPLFVDGEAPIGSKLWYRDVGVGIMLNTKWFYAGLNVDNLGRHYKNYYSTDISGDHRESTSLTGIIGTEYESITKDMKVSGYALFQNYGDLNELWAGVNAQYKWIQGGIATSSNLGMAASVGVVLDKVSFHYNLDNTYSALKDEKLLSHQLTMRILMKPSRYAAKFLNM